MSDLVVFAVWALATARVVGLVTVDEVSANARKWLIEHLDERPRTFGNTLSRILSCPWCFGVYAGVAMAAVFAVGATNPWLFYPALALAFAQLAGVLNAWR